MKMPIATLSVDQWKSVDWITIDTYNCFFSFWFYFFSLPATNWL